MAVNGFSDWTREPLLTRGPSFRKGLDFALQALEDTNIDMQWVCCVGTYTHTYPMNEEVLTE